MTAIPCCCFRRSLVVDMFAVSDKHIAVDALREQLMDPGAGGLCIFEGWVRNENEGRTVERLSRAGRHGASCRDELRRIFEEALQI